MYVYNAKVRYKNNFSPMRQLRQSLRNMADLVVKTCTQSQVTKM